MEILQQVLGGSVIRVQTSSFFAAPAIRTTSTIETAPSFWNMIGVRETPPFYTQASPSGIWQSESHASDSQDEGPFITSGPIKMPFDVQPSLRSQRHVPIKDGTHQEGGARPNLSHVESVVNS
jgi:hypothetical protein